MIVLLMSLALIVASLRVGFGEWLHAMPSVGLVAVLLASRRAPDGRYRWIAILSGLLAGAVIPYGAFLSPIALLLSGALARATRRAFLVNRLPLRLLLGAVFAGVESLILLLLAKTLGAPLVIEGPLWIFLGFFGTGILYALSEALISSHPRLRHALERP